MGFSPLKLFNQLYSFLEGLGGPVDGRISSTDEERMQALQTERDTFAETVRYIQDVNRGVRAEDRLERARLMTNYDNASRVHREMQTGYCTDKRHHPQHYAVIL